MYPVVSLCLAVHRTAHQHGVPVVFILLSEAVTEAVCAQQVRSPDCSTDLPGEVQLPDPDVSSRSCSKLPGHPHDTLPQVLFQNVLADTSREDGATTTLEAGRGVVVGVTDVAATTPGGGGAPALATVGSTTGVGSKGAGSLAGTTGGMTEGSAARGAAARGAAAGTAAATMGAATGAAAIGATAIGATAPPEVLTGSIATADKPLSLSLLWTSVSSMITWLLLSTSRAEASGPTLILTAAPVRDSTLSRTMPMPVNVCMELY